MDPQPPPAKSRRRQVPWWVWLVGSALVAGIAALVAILWFVVVAARSDDGSTADGYCTQYSPGVWGESQDYPWDPDCPNYRGDRQAGGSA